MTARIADGDERVDLSADVTEDPGQAKVLRDALHQVGCVCDCPAAVVICQTCHHDRLERAATRALAELRMDNLGDPEDQEVVGAILELEGALPQSAVERSWVGAPEGARERWRGMLAVMSGAPGAREDGPATT